MVNFNMIIIIFDAHADILFDVYQAKLRGDNKRFNDYHLPQLKNRISGGIWAVYSSYEFDLIKALSESKELVDLKNFEVILGIEGLRNLKNLADLQTIYELGYRHIMLTWNEANAYATGVEGPSDRGLTEKGYQVLDFMISHDLIIDVSHLNDKSFNDVLNYTNKNIIASHSNLRSLCDRSRNLTEEQVYKLKEADALLGLTFAGSFIAKEIKDRTLDSFMLHLKKAISIMGIDNVCFGFDFMDYFSYKTTANIEELKDASMVQNLIDKLFAEGYKKEEIEKLTYYNFINRYQRHLVK